MNLTPHLETLANLTPRTDMALIGLTQGQEPEIADLACALWHERSGQHFDGCTVCDLEAVEAFAGEVLEAAHLVAHLSVLLPARVE